MSKAIATNHKMTVNYFTAANVNDRNLIKHSKQKCVLADNRFSQPFRLSLKKYCGLYSQSYLCMQMRLK